MSADDQRAAERERWIRQQVEVSRHDPSNGEAAMAWAVGEVDRLRAELAATRDRRDYLQGQLDIIYDAEYSRNDALARRIEKMGTAGDNLAGELDRPAGTEPEVRALIDRWRSVRGDTPTDDCGSTDTVSVPPKSSQSTAPADDPDPQDEVDRLGSVLFEVCRSAMLDPFMPVDEIPREVGRLARLASAAAPDVGTAAGWVARIPGPCWVVGDPEDDWEESHHPGQVAAEDQARRWELPGPVRQLDGECWIAARVGRLVVDDDIGVVHHRTEGEARAAADTAAPRSRDNLVDRFTAAVNDVCDAAAIDVVVHELEPGPHGWEHSGQTSPLRRLVRALNGAGLLDETALEETR